MLQCWSGVQRAVPDQCHWVTGTIWSFSWLALTSAEPHQLKGHLLEETRLSSAFPNSVQIILRLVPLRLAFEDDLGNLIASTEVGLLMEAVSKPPSLSILRRAIQPTCLGWLV